MFPYENLTVYKKTFELNSVIYSMLKRNSGIPAYLKVQFGRASLSIMLNIAEGSGKSSLRDRRNFLSIARGSVFECASIVEFLFVQNEISESERNDLKDGFEQLSKMLYTMIRNLNEVGLKP